MDRNRIREFARNFPENGMRLLLEDTRNVRDLLGLAGHDLAERLDLDRLAPFQETFVRRDFRHVRADVVVTAPLRDRAAAVDRAWVYATIEHQSEPDRTMLLRLIDSVVQILRYQEREWERTHGTTAGIEFQPVVPVVFYTGERRWPVVRSLGELMVPEAGFREWAPQMASCFVNVGAIAAEVLAARGGFSGPVVRLLPARRAPRGEFKERLAGVIRFLEGMPGVERVRWLDLLSYIHALVYHVRHADEHPGLWRAIEASVATGAHRQEVTDVGKTMADVLRDQGHVEGRAEGSLETARKTLVRLLRRRFGEVPEATIAVIESTADLERLNGWLDRFATAQTLEDVGIG